MHNAEVGAAYAQNLARTNIKIQSICWIGSQARLVSQAARVPGVKVLIQLIC
jgi:hypothetical protein